MQPDNSHFALCGGIFCKSYVPKDPTSWSRLASARAFRVPQVTAWLYEPQLFLPKAPSTEWEVSSPADGLADVGRWRWRVVVVGVVGGVALPWPTRAAGFGP